MFGGLALHGGAAMVAPRVTRTPSTRPASSGSWPWFTPRTVRPRA